MSKHSRNVPFSPCGSQIGNRAAATFGDVKIAPMLNPSCEAAQHSTLAEPFGQRRILFDARAVLKFSDLAKRHSQI